MFPVVPFKVPETDELFGTNRAFVYLSDLPGIYGVGVVDEDELSCSGEGFRGLTCCGCTGSPGRLLPPRGPAPVVLQMRGQNLNGSEGSITPDTLENRLFPVLHHLVPPHAGQVGEGHAAFITFVTLVEPHRVHVHVPQV